MSDQLSLLPGAHTEAFPSLLKMAAEVEVALLHLLMPKRQAWDAKPQGRILWVLTTILRVNVSSARLEILSISCVESLANTYRGQNSKAGLLVSINFLHRVLCSQHCRGPVTGEDQIRVSILFSPRAHLHTVALEMRQNQNRACVFSSATPLSPRISKAWAHLSEISNSQHEPEMETGVRNAARKG